MFTIFATFQCSVNGITFPIWNSVLIRCPLPCLAIPANLSILSVSRNLPTLDLWSKGNYAEMVFL